MVFIEAVIFYRLLPYIVYSLSVIAAIIAGFLVYHGLSSRRERLHYRLRFKQALKEQQEQLKDISLESKLEKIFKEAGYPLGINALRWQIGYYSLFVLLVINYVFVPMLRVGDYSLVGILLIVIIMLFLNPNFPYSLSMFILRRWTEYKKAKKNAELFSLFDLLIGEIQMMNSTRVNAYNLLRGLKRNFTEIDKELNNLLVNWNSDKGPVWALDEFAKELDTNEAKSLATVLKTFDENNKETILKSLKGMESTFINSQIENYRRKRRLYVDLGKLPIKSTHFLILLNFVVVVVYMVSFIMSESRFSL